jgi:hypothetical protein
MDTDFYKDAFEKAIQELFTLTARRNALDDQREELNARLDQLRKGALGLSSMCGEDPKSVEQAYPELFPQLIEPEIGLTEAIRIVVKSNIGKKMTPVEIRRGLLNIGFDLSRYRNPLATIHITLRRLSDNHEIEVGVNEPGRTVYWLADKEREKGEL